MQSNSISVSVDEPLMGRELSQLPSTAVLLWRLGYSSFQKRRANPANFRADIRNLTELRANEKELSKYRDVCGLTESPNLPLMFPQIMSSRLMYDLLLSPAMPFGIAGFVHLSHEVIARDVMPADRSYDFECRTDGMRETPRGYEIDVVTRALYEGREVWRSNAVFLHRTRTSKRSSKKQNSEQSAEISYQVDASCDLAANLGRQYAAVSRDYNPIHLSKWTARLFGFDSPIAHGLWLMAKASAVYGDQALKSMSIQFRAPVHLPNKIKFSHGVQDEACLFRIGAERGAQIFANGQFKRNNG